MKYKEFKQWCEDNNYIIRYEDDCIQIESSTGDAILHISNKIEKYISVFRTVLNTPRSITLHQKALELALTPRVDRGVEKSYYVKLKLTDYDRDSLYLDTHSDGELFWNYLKRKTFYRHEIEDYLNNPLLELIEVEE